MKYIRYKTKNKKNLKEKENNGDMENCRSFRGFSYIYIYIYIDDDDDDDNSRDEGPGYRYWVVGRTRGRQRARGQISTSEGR